MPGNLPGKPKGTCDSRASRIEDQHTSISAISRMRFRLDKLATKPGKRGIAIMTKTVG